MGRPEVEILAPAGSRACLEAALKAGADAVYVGGGKFGARAFADNFTQEELLEAIDYVHVHGRRLYLTVNTLLKEEELEGELYAYLLPLYQQGLDAVIVQDLGVLRYVRKTFPDLPIHASTQMTITDAAGARLMESYGVERIVTSRELSLAEIRQIADETQVEIESFVHGALCYCYSGQCLYSSLIGGRSGNRGQCAQPCRLPYRVDGKKQTEYVLSLKDICTLELIPQLVEAGIYSFKIEGRMKKPEYVALVTAMYRKYTDLYLANGAAGFAVEPQDKQDLMDLYNRGGFHTGYYQTRNGREMVSLDRPNHAGVPALTVLGGKHGDVQVQALTDLHPGDVIELPGKETYTMAEAGRKGSILHLRIGKNVRWTPKMVWNRTRNASLIEEIQKKQEACKLQEPIEGQLTLSKTEKACLKIRKEDLEVVVYGEKMEPAMNQPATEERVVKQLKKTGNTPFFFDTLTVALEGDLFVPMQGLNELRRQALGQLEEEICRRYRRAPVERPTWEQVPIHKVREEKIQIYALAETLEQYEALIGEEAVSRIYLDANSMACIWKQDLHKILQVAHAKAKEVYFAMPHIFRRDTREKYEDVYEAFFGQAWDGVLIRNMESYVFLRDMGYQKPIAADHHVYQFNSQSKAFWREHGVEQLTAPLELNDRELGKVDVQEQELVVYGYLPMMVSAQCVRKTTKGCKHQPEQIWMKDRYQKEFLVRNRCDYCYNMIYNTDPLWLAGQKEEILKLQPKALRLSFTRERGVEVKGIVRDYVDAFWNGEHPKEPDGYTRGHFKRGVK